MTAVLAIAVLANLGPQYGAVGLTFGLAFLLWNGWLAGSWLAPHEQRHWQLAVGLVAQFALLTVAGAGAYWLYQLNPLAIGLLLIAAPMVWLKLRAQQPMKPAAIYRDFLRGLPRTLGVSTWLTAAVLVFAAVHFRWLQAAATTGAIRTPWQVTPRGFFLNYLLLVLASLTLAWRTDRAGRRLPVTMLATAAGLAVPLLVYPLGFGFDSIIHQATEREIFSAGEITPKPPYYIGQYALVVTLGRLLAAPIVAVDRLAAPLGLLLVAAYLYRPWRTISTAAALPLLLLLMPYAALSVTTPQTLGNLWVLLTVLTVAFGALDESFRRFRALSVLTAAAAMVTHPIAGVPAIVAAAAGWMISTGDRRGSLAPAKKIGLALTVATGALALPLLFLLQAKLNGYPFADVWNLQLLPQRIWELRSAWLPGLPRSSAPLLDFAYAVDRYRWWMIAAIAGVGIAALPYRSRWRTAAPPITASASMLGSFLVLIVGMQFPQLVAGEQLVFPKRAWELAQLSLLPLLIIGGAALFDRCRRVGVLRAALFILLPAFLTAQLYLAYPRADRYQFDHGFNVTASDIAAVRHVAADAAGDYLVLANQMTAAAAVREFGFSRSYPAADGSQRRYFAYPIPTGEPLYLRYLEMVERRGNRQVARDAAALVAADIRSVYFILDGYWDGFNLVAEQAKREADRWWEIGDGQAIVFRYVLVAPPP